jgi:hypothetical protein
MAQRNTLAHNPNLAGEVSGWHYLGENVGVGYSVSSLAMAFWESPEHRSNILDPHYTRVGVAVAEVSGKLWVAEEFELPSSSGASRSGGAARSADRTHDNRTPAPRHPKAAQHIPNSQQPDRCPRKM